MLQATKEEQHDGGLQKYLSPIGVWAFAFGCSVGWGAFVMPGTTFIPIAGPIGSVIGIIIGGLLMLLIGMNYHYMMNRYPDCGGTFAFSKNEIGYDHGFLSAWFLELVYMAIIWANATAIPLVCKNLFHDYLDVGPSYTIAGFTVYVDEALIAAAAILIAGFVCTVGGKFSSVIQTILACILIAGILLCAAEIFLKNGAGSLNFEPVFAPKSNAGLEIFQIVALAPWAYVGFESISHSTEEFQFSPKKTLGIMLIALITGMIAYSLLVLIAVSKLPQDCADWTVYLETISSREGLEGLPTFYAIHSYMGKRGLSILCATLIAGIMTGLIGNMVAASRLIYAIARDEMIPQKMSRLNKNHVPAKIIWMITLISLPIPFFGRTAISWIVDVNTVGATIAYAYTSGVAFQAARKEKRLAYMVTGGIGIVLSVVFTCYFLIPNFWSASKMAPASYLILIAWSILGFIFFHYVFRRDEQRRFGKSTVVWIVLLFLVFFVTMLWFRETSQEVSEQVLVDLNSYNEMELAEHGIMLNDTERKDSEYFTESKMQQINHSMQQNSMIQMGIILFALFIMFNIYNAMHKRHEEMEVQKLAAEESNKAKSTFLSNMSHDIRTPMNAIIGYTKITMGLQNLPTEAEDYLKKIDSSSKHLLSLINDVLDMSRIESGKMELDIAPSDILQTMEEVKDLFITQMDMKGIHYTVNAEDVDNRYVMCDTNRLNRILLNLISNAFKFTESGGTVSVTLKQVSASEGKGSYELHVKDTGMGMSPEFAAKVFEAYERERTVNKIQGTGLGMAITKNLVNLMGGTIEVQTEQGKGTEFIIHVDFPFAEKMAEEEENAEKQRVERDYSQIKILLVEDQEINREIAAIMLEEYQFQLDFAENGQIAVDKIKNSKPGEFQIILMDVQMPVMNGYEATRAIRSLSDAQLASIPIFAMTANAFSDDVQAAKDAGMNGHLSKPIDMDKILEAIDEI